ncbi:MAG: hypothetical protein K8F58_02505 [Bauldia sp.]|nr:hypothetical protein [Bauldia sp.]
MIDEAGENLIASSLGANEALAVAEIDKAVTAGDEPVLLTQAEIPLVPCRAAGLASRRTEKIAILNQALDHGPHAERAVDFDRGNRGAIAGSDADCRHLPLAGGKKKPSLAALLHCTISIC